MIYNTIKIDSSNGGYIVTACQSTLDREEETTYPRSAGYYHYPSSITAKQAFEELRLYMVIERKREIESIKHQIIELLSLKLKVEELICTHKKM